MLAYHGTTQMRARQIFERGFLPKPPSRRVWFAEQRAYAMGRARTQARRAGDVPVVLACDLDLDRLRRQLGATRLVCRKGIIAIDGAVPAAMLAKSAFADMATVPEEVARWLTDLLRLDPDDAVRTDHPGVARLSRWINARPAIGPEPTLLCSELLERAKRWLPEYFLDVVVGLDSLRAHRRVGLVRYELDERRFEPDPREAEALGALDDPRVERRIEGLSLLAAIGDPDLFDWCAMMTEDEAPAVRIAALRTMLQCKDAAEEVIAPLANSPDRHVRAAAIAALATHAGADAPRWIERGLRDPEPCVRCEAVRFLDRLDPRRHRPVLELAKHDPNTDIADRARKFIGERS